MSRHEEEVTPDLFVPFKVGDFTQHEAYTDENTSQIIIRQKNLERLKSKGVSCQVDFGTDEGAQTNDEKTQHSFDLTRTPSENFIKHFYLRKKRSDRAVC